MWHSPEIIWNEKKLQNSSGIDAKRPFMLRPKLTHMTLASRFLANMPCMQVCLLRYLHVKSQNKIRLSVTPRNIWKNGPLTCWQRRNIDWTEFECSLFNSNLSIHAGLSRPELNSSTKKSCIVYSSISRLCIRVCIFVYLLKFFIFRVCIVYFANCLIVYSRLSCI